jgi:flavin-dependent dehydrogenase
LRQPPGSARFRRRRGGGDDRFVRPDYPVVIAGGGYAGLAAALALGHRALVIDQHAVGAVQRSACGLPVHVAERLGVGDAVLQVATDGYVHTARGTSAFRLDPPYCVFDHARFCRGLFERSGAHFLRARVQGLDGETVQTSAGPVRGQVLIDATGWPATLASARRPELTDRARLSVGIEAEIPGREDGLHFWFDPEFAPRGYGWLFPAGETVRIGVAAFHPNRDGLAEGLDRLLSRLGYEGKPCRGGMIPWFDRPSVIDGIFLAGDAAGHCLPLTAEGIRFALAFGELAGSLAAGVVDGRLDRQAAQEAYLRSVARHRRRVGILRQVQRLVGPLPNRIIQATAALLALPGIEPRVMARYASWSDLAVHIEGG